MSENKNEAAVTNDANGADARGYRKTARGYVVSDKMDKTIVVEVEDRVKHALYGKVLRRTSKRKAHDEQLRTQEVGERFSTVLEQLASQPPSATDAQVLTGQRRVFLAQSPLFLTRTILAAAQPVLKSSGRRVSVAQTRVPIAEGSVFFSQG